MEFVSRNGVVWVSYGIGQRAEAEKWIEILLAREERRAFREKLRSSRDALNPLANFVQIDFQEVICNPALPPAPLDSRIFNCENVQTFVRMQPRYIPSGRCMLEWKTTADERNPHEVNRKPMDAALKKVERRLAQFATVTYWREFAEMYLPKQDARRYNAVISDPLAVMAELNRLRIVAESNRLKAAAEWNRIQEAYWSL